jgi:hypothetical protein
LVRGDDRELCDIGPVQDEQTCLKALLTQLEQLGYCSRVVAQHDNGWGCLVEGVRAKDGAEVQAIAWTSEYMRQGCLEIYFQRLGMLRPPGGVQREDPKWRPVLTTAH